MWKSRQEDNISKTQDQVTQQTLDFDNAVDIATATNKGTMKEKLLPQENAHGIAREEVAKQCKIYFARLKATVEKNYPLDYIIKIKIIQMLRKPKTMVKFNTTKTKKGKGKKITKKYLLQHQLTINATTLHHPMH